MTISNLALQGGGAHGAFTWGVLDYLLEHRLIQPEGISGTSAGAMNGAVLMSGYLEDGPDGARSRLDELWNGISLQDPFGGWASLWANPLTDYGFAAVTKSLVGMTRWLSPYDRPAGERDPLRELVRSLVDFERLNSSEEMKLYVSTTEVRTGKLRIFSNGELSVETLVASACLPSLNKAVEIDGELYWDGGWAGNPVMYPLIEETSAQDIFVILLQPLEQTEAPRRAQEISTRVAELGFSSAFTREMQEVARTRKRLRAQGEALNHHDRRYLDARFHMVEDGRYLEGLKSQSQLDIRQSFLKGLKKRGRKAAREWDELHSDKLGSGSSFEVEQNFG